VHPARVAPCKGCTLQGLDAGQVHRKNSPCVNSCKVLRRHCGARRAGTRGPRRQFIPRAAAKYRMRPRPVGELAGPGPVERPLRVNRDARTEKKRTDSQFSCSQRCPAASRKSLCSHSRTSTFVAAMLTSCATGTGSSTPAHREWPQRRMAPERKLSTTVALFTRRRLHESPAPGRNPGGSADPHRPSGAGVASTQAALAAGENSDARRAPRFVPFCICMTLPSRIRDKRRASPAGKGPPAVPSRNAGLPGAPDDLAVRSKVIVKSTSDGTR